MQWAQLKYMLCDEIFSTGLGRWQTENLQFVILQAWKQEMYAIACSDCGNRLRNFEELVKHTLWNTLSVTISTDWINNTFLFITATWNINTHVFFNALFHLLLFAEGSVAWLLNMTANLPKINLLWSILFSGIYWH